MHPAPSIILFTALSGLGFGLLFWLALGVSQVTGLAAFLWFAFAYLMAVGGLAASAFHLGNPQRALRAFSQWRSSWLSREACLSVAALLVMAGYGAGLVVWQLPLRALGWPGAALCLATVFATSMIYGQLKTVPRWNHWTTSALFLALSVAGGAGFVGHPLLASMLMLAAGMLQIAVWYLGDARFAIRGSSMATATGLGGIGTVRQFSPPHTGTNYLLREMVFRIGRKHALRLRVLSVLLMAVVPALLLLLVPGQAAPVLAMPCHFAGVMASRWLFFAEAEHVVGLYYGAEPGRVL